MDFSLLDEKPIEQEDPKGFASPTKASKPRQPAKTSFAKDDEMQVYLAEIRHKQQELDRKLKQSEEENKKRIEDERRAI